MIAPVYADATILAYMNEPVVLHTVEVDDSPVLQADSPLEFVFVVDIFPHNNSTGGGSNSWSSVVQRTLNDSSSIPNVLIANTFRSMFSSGASPYNVEPHEPYAYTYIVTSYVRVCIHVYFPLPEDGSHVSAFGRSLKSLAETPDWISALFSNAMGEGFALPDIRFEIGTLEENVLSSFIGASHVVILHNDMLVGRGANHGKYDFVSDPSWAGT